MADTRSENGRPGRRRLTLRLRLTLLYGGCFLVAGACLLAITYALVAHDTSLQANALKIRTTAVTTPETTTSPGATNSPATTTSESSTVTTPSGAGNTTTTIQPVSKPERARLRTLRHQAQAQLNSEATKANSALRLQRRQSLGALLTLSGGALGVLGVISILLGWLVAGRALRPLRTMTVRARAITEDDLGARLSVDGRRDELGELAGTFDDVLARLERAFDTQRRFVANASHELRTPITLERTLLEVALADSDQTLDGLRAVCQRVVESTAQQERMLEALLTLARSQSGTIDGHPVELSTLLQKAVDRRREKLGKIDLTLATETARTEGDVGLLERLIDNLIDNAIRHNAGPSRWISAATGTDDQGPWLRVGNSGVVVPDAAVSGLLEPFRRLKDDRTSYDDGLGLGLSIVHAITRAHGAELQVEPLRAGGLSFRIRFPPAGLSAHL